VLVGHSFGGMIAEKLLGQGLGGGAVGKPLFEAASANFHAHSPDEVDTANSERGPLLLIGGGKDHTVPTAVTRSTLKQYKGSAAVTDLVEFPDRSHSLTVDDGWGELADAALSLLDKNGLGPG
jgi:pimeloyl-ACP methyl ester carboxylesterase